MSTRHRSRRLLATIAALATLATSPVLADANPIPMAAPETVGMSSERLERIGEGMRRMIDAGKIPGTVTLVARRGKVVHFETNGLRNIAAGLPMEEDTIFRLYSQSKPVTGAAVMILFEEGHFLLTDPVSKYLPEFADMRVYLGEQDGEMVTEPAGPITIQQLATHTSGLTYGFIPTAVGKMYTENGVVATGTPLPIEGGDADVAPPTSPAGVEREAGDDAAGGSAGDRVELQRRHGRPRAPGRGGLRDVLRGLPAGTSLRPARHDGHGLPRPRLQAPAFRGELRPGGGRRHDAAGRPRDQRLPQAPALQMGGAGLVGTVGDYLRFAQMLANKGEFQGTRILGRKTVEFMMSNHLTPVFPDDPMTALRNQLGATRQWGVGFGITGSVVTNPATSGLPVSAGTYGWGGAATTGFWVDHEEELVGIVHTQLTPSGTYPVRQLMQLLTYQAIID